MKMPPPGAARGPLAARQAMTYFSPGGGRTLMVGVLEIAVSNPGGWICSVADAGWRCVFVAQLTRRRVNYGHHEGMMSDVLLLVRRGSSPPSEFMT